MKKMLVLGVFVAVLCVSAMPAMADLQSVLNGITVGPNPGVSSVNVATNALIDGQDSYWKIGGSGGSISTIVIELAGYAGDNKFGIYDAANPSKTVQLFAGVADAGDQVVVGIKADGSVILNLTNDTGINFGGNLFGFYLNSPDGMFYSDTSLNESIIVNDKEIQIDHMLAVQGKDIDTIEIADWGQGDWGSNEYILGFEDLLGGGDMDYDDFVVMVESVNPVPVPGAILLGFLGIGAAGLKLRRFA